MLLAAFAFDYDGTIAHDGRVDDDTVAALKRLKASGRRLLLVTGRQLPDLQRVFTAVDLFDIVVAENGALLFLPALGEERPLAAPPPPDFLAALARRGVAASVGRCIVATWEPNETKVLDAIRELGLEWQIIFNKGAVMCLPAGVNKASGLGAALETSSFRRSMSSRSVMPKTIMPSSASAAVRSRSPMQSTPSRMRLISPRRARAALALRN
jgi:hypothetical protein